MNRAEQPWFVGAWRRRSIVVPRGEPSEPCEAWWIQADSAFVDVRVTLAGHEHNGLPYSSTRAFAGRFELAEGVPCWHVELDTDGAVPRTDRGAVDGLFIDPDDPLLMIEDAPGRFREHWVQCAPSGEIEFVRADGLISVRVGDVAGVVMRGARGVLGQLWHGDHSIAIAPAPSLDRHSSSSR